MDINFPINKIEFKLNIVGKCKLVCMFNGNEVDVSHPVVLENFDDHNTFFLQFNKYPADDSFAVLEYFRINDVSDHLEWFKAQPFSIDRTIHPDSDDYTIPNNAYFGYNGSMQIDISNKHDKLTEAAWLLADKEFEQIKYPLREGIYRTKDFHTMQRDAKYMFTGSLAPANENINNAINSIDIASLRRPFNLPTDRQKIESWLAESNRVDLLGLDQLEHFSFSAGNLDSLTSFINNKQLVFMPNKMYYYHGEVLADKNVIVCDPWGPPIGLYANVLFEYPSPWYTLEELDKKITECKEKQANIALDLTWLPISNEKIQLDLDGINEIYFSMNKTWPIHDVRPAFRWSRHRINDKQTFESEWGNYAKLPPNMFLHLIDKFPFDYVYDNYSEDAESICKTFGLEKTSVLWFMTHESVAHDTNGYISPHYHLDEFVCIRKLLEHKDKYFW